MLNWILDLILLVAVAVMAVIAVTAQKECKVVKERLASTAECCDEITAELHEMEGTIERCMDNMIRGHDGAKEVFIKLAQVLGTLPEYRNANREQASRGNRLKNKVHSILVGQLETPDDTTEQPLYLECQARLDRVKELLGDKE